MIWVNEDTFRHLVLDHDPKDAALRKALMSLIANIDGATLAALEERGSGQKTLRVLLPFDRFFHVAAKGDRGARAERPTALILWFDDAMRVRSIMPSTDAKFRAGAAQRGDTIIDLEKS